MSAMIHAINGEFDPETIEGWKVIGGFVFLYTRDDRIFYTCPGGEWREEVIPR